MAQKQFKVEYEFLAPYDFTIHISIGFNEEVGIIWWIKLNKLSDSENLQNWKILCGTYTVIYGETMKMMDKPGKSFKSSLLQTTTNKNYWFVKGQ